jgi:ClpP class serine protease
MLHRQESLSFLGIAISRYIDIEDSEHIFRAIRLTPDNMPIDIILHTPGGLVLASEQIAYALQRHPSKVTVMVPHYAMSGGTMLALAADEILMDENAVLGPVDPQIGQYPAVSIVKVTKEKDINAIDDNTLILADISQKAIRQVENTIFNLLVDEMPEDKALDIAKAFSEGLWTHDYPIKVDELKNMGIPVEVGLPSEVYQLMELYPQPAGRRPTVGYIPLPYEVPDKKKTNIK